MLREASDQPRHFFERQQRRRAAAEVDRLDPFARAVLPPVRLDLDEERVHERPVGAARRGEVEVAVDAALRAEGDMDVESGHAVSGF